MREKISWLDASLLFPVRSFGAGFDRVDKGILRIVAGGVPWAPPAPVGEAGLAIRLELLALVAVEAIPIPTLCWVGSPVAGSVVLGWTEVRTPVTS